MDRNRISVRGWFWIGVAPFAGAWIETFAWLIVGWIIMVAPFAGAWIETASPA